MKNESPELPPVTYKEAIKLLNGLCEGLGDKVAKLKRSRGFTHEKKDSISGFIIKREWTIPGIEFWNDIYSLLFQIESGAGIKK